MQKGNAILTAVVTFVGILIAVILVANLALPASETPTYPIASGATNSTAVSNINQTTGLATQFTSFTLTNPTNTLAGSAIVTVTTRGADYINVTDSAGNVLGVLGSTGSFTVNLTATKIVTPLILNYTTNATGSQTGGGGNVTQVLLSYYQKAASNTWDSGTQALWGTALGIALVSMLILFIFRAF